MQDQLASLAYKRQWGELLGLLNQKPYLVNVASGGKRYTPLHQAAWHGADLSVIGGLLAHGADPFLETKERQTAYDIA